MNSLIQFKGTASFSRSVDCENAERFIFKAVCGPVFAVSADQGAGVRADRLRTASTTCLIASITSAVPELEYRARFLLRLCVWHLAQVSPAHQHGE